MVERSDKLSPLVFRDCGIAGYTQILSVQQELLAARQADQIPNTIILVEHTPVITLGARKSENKLLMEESSLLQKGIEVVAIGRGGGTTAHNPGQLVIYPIINLKSLNIEISDYIRQLEQIGLELLDSLGVIAHRQKGLPGLWVGKDKIASIGVQVKKWVTLHGIAINIQNDLSIFDWIVPCGLDGVKMTSAAQQTGRQYDMAQVKAAAKALCERFYGDKQL